MSHDLRAMRSAAVQSRASDLADRFVIEVGGVLLAAELYLEGCRDTVGGGQMRMLLVRTLELAASYPVTWSLICGLGGIPAPAAFIPTMEAAADGGAGEHRAALVPDIARVDVLASLRIAALQVAARIRELTDEQLEHVVQRRGPRKSERSVEYLITAALIRPTRGHFERLLLMRC